MYRYLVMAMLVGGLVAACAPPAAQPAPAAPPPRPAAGGSPAAPAATAPRPRERLGIGTSSPSLSFLPATLADRLGYYAEEGLDPEFVQVRGNSVIPALLAGELDFTTLLSAIGAHASQGGPSKIVQFHSVKLQHVLTVRPEITDVSQLAGKRIGVESLGTLTAFESRKLIDYYNLPDVAIVAIGGDLERIAALESNAADASTSAVPSNLVAEKRGFPTLLRIGTILEIPQAGFGGTEALLREQPDKVARALRATARALPLIQNQRDLVIQKIGEWLDLSPEDAARAYDLVADTYSPNGLPTDAQMAAYLDLMRATAGAPADAKPSDLADFTIARRVAGELGLPSAP
ncbi:MAG TPA: ABC transporter substrate-binding protein [Chloroflexota bacterium]|nr:ABC transporter substrate-binding protein [Chloroflexota bacterium]